MRVCVICGSCLQENLSSSGRQFSEYLIFYGGFRFFQAHHWFQLALLFSRSFGYPFFRVTIYPCPPVTVAGPPCSNSCLQQRRHWLTSSIFAGSGPEGAPWTSSKARPVMVVVAAARDGFLVAYLLHMMLSSRADHHSRRIYFHESCAWMGQACISKFLINDSYAIKPPSCRFRPWFCSIPFKVRLNLCMAMTVTQNSTERVSTYAYRLSLRNSSSAGMAPAQGQCRF